MEFRLYGLVKNSYVDGPGIRLAIFFQGCLNHCKGCHNHDSWDVSGGRIFDTDEVQQMMLSDPLLDGITLSGGEPFLQTEALDRIAEDAHDMGLNVWCYSGYTYEELYSSSEGRYAMRNIDVLVDGPFKQELKSMDCKWRGSTNQRLVDVRKSLMQGSGKAIEYECE